MGAAGRKCYLSVCYYRMDIGFSLCLEVIGLQTGAFQSSNQALTTDDLVDLGMIDIYVEMQLSHLLLVALTPFRWAKSRYNS
jgi:hypothetical protein